jgi:hypothetical protein
LGVVKVFERPREIARSVTRAPLGESAADADGARDDGFSATDEAWFCLSYSRITEECRTSPLLPRSPAAIEGL